MSERGELKKVPAKFQTASQEPDFLVQKAGEQRTLAALSSEAAPPGMRRGRSPVVHRNLPEFRRPV
jgi:hypothetical protein